MGKNNPHVNSRDNAPKFIDLTEVATEFTGDKTENHEQNAKLVTCTNWRKIVAIGKVFKFVLCIGEATEIVNEFEKLDDDEIVLYDLHFEWTSIIFYVSF